MSEHRVLVCGGRNYRDYAKVEATLDALRPAATVIIHGAAPGADSMADAWAKELNLNILRFYAKWDDLSHPNARIRTRRDGSKYDANAGPRRNQLMIDLGRPDLVVAFPGGTGTADMVRRARAAAVRLIEVK